MRVYVLTFCFFWWIAIRIDISLAAQMGDLDEDDQLKQNLFEDEVVNGTQSTVYDVLYADDISRFSEKLNKLNFLKAYEIYNSLGPRKNMAAEFDRLLWWCRTFGNIRHAIWDVKVNDLLEPIGKQVVELSDDFLKRTKENKNKLLQILPNLDETEKIVLEEQYEKYKQLNWSYENGEIVLEADKMTKELIWPGEGVPSKDILNPVMYHVLNDELCLMKKQLSESERVISLAKQLQKIIADSHVFITEKEPCTAEELEKNLLFSAHKDVLLFQSRLESASLITDLSADMNIVNNAFSSLARWTQYIDEQILAEVENLKDSLQCVSDEPDEHLLENLTAQHYICTDSTYQTLETTIYKHGKGSSLKNIIDALRNVYFIAEHNSDFFGDMQKEIYTDLKKILHPEQDIERIKKKEHMQKKGSHYQSIVTNVHRIKHMKTYKIYAETILQVLTSVKEEATSVDHERGVTDTEGGTPGDKYIYVQNVMQHLEIPITRINWLRDTLYLNMQLNATLKKYENYHSSIRMLQYFWGSASQMAENVTTNKKYKKKKKKSETILKEIALALYNSALTIKQFSENKSDL